ncbi:site-specific integrase, partial [Salinivibrio sp. VYel6]|uniref:tyrosine-type recombinase/integrase n=1 Tax=Salinivibrio sp. VYel6 TaxID=2490493 RepID=UPI00128C447A
MEVSDLLLEKYKIVVRPRGSSFQADFKVNGKRRQLSRKKREDAIEAALVALGVRASAPSSDGVTRYDNVEVLLKKGTNRKETLEYAFLRACKRKWNDDQKDSAKTRRTAARVLDYFGWKTHPREITSFAVAEFCDYMSDRGKTGSTINRHLSCLSVILRNAAVIGVINTLPYIERAKEGKRRDRFFTDKEEAAMIKYMAETGRTDYADFIKLGIDTGCRTGELLRLCWGDVAEDFQSILLRDTKNGEQRRVPLLKRSAQVLKRRKANLGGTGFFDNVFRGMTQDKLSWHWNIMRRDLGYADDPCFVPHVMRHTCTTRMAARNITSDKMMEWLGHKSPSMVKRYTHMNVTHLQDVRKVMD